MNAWTIKKIHDRGANHYLWGSVKLGGDDECWEWVGSLDRYGYGYLHRERAHRIAWELFNGTSLKPFVVVRHECGNTKCCNPRHLFAGTQLDNVESRIRRQRNAIGSNNGRAKLNPEKVLSIVASEASHRSAAKTYGVNERTVRDIRSGRLWAHLTKINHLPIIGR